MTQGVDGKKGFRSQLRNIRFLLKQNIDLYRGIYEDRRTPRLAKALLWLAIGYVLLPIDIVPDFIPILGQLDDLIMVPLIIYFAIKMIPDDVYKEHRSKTSL